MQRCPFHLLKAAAYSVPGHNNVSKNNKQALGILVLDYTTASGRSVKIAGTETSPWVLLRCSAEH